MFEIAHGFVGRSDLPIPQWLFGWAAAVVLIVSFAGLAVLWPEPRLQDGGFRPLPRRVSAVLTSRVLDVACGLIGVLLLVLVVWTGLSGTQVPTGNFASTFVLVTFWVGLVPLSILFGDVFRKFNPWRAIGRAVSWLAGRASSGPLPSALTYPERLGHWPAAAGIFLFAALELVSSTGRNPDSIAIAALVYSAATFVAMALYGVEAWCERGEAFSVYFNLFSRISVWTRRGADLGLRRPLSGLAQLEPGHGTVALLAVMIGSTTFDGASEAPIWTGVAPDIADFFRSLGLSPEHALEVSFLIGLILGVSLIYGLYMIGIAGARSVGGGFTSKRLANVFVHSLVPIALAYVSAHYLTYLLTYNQGIVSFGLLPPHIDAGFLASNPLGHEGTDLFGTAGKSIDYGVIGATTTWYYQVAFVVVGHVAALTLAHDRALAVYDKARLAVRSQYWMLAVMVCFTSLALWLLSQSNA